MAKQTTRAEKPDAGKPPAGADASGAADKTDSKESGIQAENGDGEAGGTETETAGTAETGAAEGTNEPRPAGAIEAEAVAESAGAESAGDVMKPAGGGWFRDVLLEIDRAAAVYDAVGDWTDADRAAISAGFNRVAFAASIHATRFAPPPSPPEPDEDDILAVGPAGTIVTRDGRKIRPAAK